MRYIDVRKAIREKIDNGEWCVGYKLPREMELCGMFEVSRTTVRRALSELDREGLIRRVKGTGTFVSRPQLFDKTTFFIKSFAEELKAQGLTAVSEVLEQHTVLSDEHIASALEIQKGSPVLKLRRLRYSREMSTDGPITLTTSYFPMSIGNVLQSVDFENLSLYDAMRKYGIVRAQCEKTVSATRLSGRDCRLLLATEEDLFLIVTTVSYDRDRRPVEYCESCYPVDRNVFRLHVVTET